MATFKSELESLLNRYSMENGSNTPDYILADYLNHCLAVFDATVRERERWYGRTPKSSNQSPLVGPCLESETREPTTEAPRPAHTKTYACVKPGGDGCDGGCKDGQ